MMTEFRAHIRSRVGPRVAQGLDHFAPLFAAGQARRVAVRTGSHVAASEANRGATDQMTPVPVGLRSAEQSALAPVREYSAAHVSPAVERAPAQTDMTYHRGLRLVVDQDKSSVRAPAQSSSDVPQMTPATAEAQNKPVTRRTETDAKAAGVWLADAPHSDRADTRKTDQFRTTATPGPSKGAGPAPQGDVPARPSAAMEIIALLHRAATRRAVPLATTSGYGPSVPVSLSPVPTLAAPPLDVPNRTRQTGPANPDLRPQPVFAPSVAEPVSPHVQPSEEQAISNAAVSPLTAAGIRQPALGPSPALTPLARLDQYLPRAEMRPNASPSDPDTGRVPNRTENEFAFDLRVQAALSRLLQQDMQRHGLHPHGEVL